jgi:ferredoxin
MEISPGLLAEVKEFGDFDVRGCFNCGSCTIVCPFSDGLETFPRRVIRYVHYGMKARLAGSLEPWLCYYCGDCMDSCPREAEPGESMMTLRRYLSSVYDWTGISSLINRFASARILAHVAVSGLLFLLIYLYHLYWESVSSEVFFRIPVGLEHVFDNMVYFVLVVFLLPVVLLFINGWRMYRRATAWGSAPPFSPSLYLSEVGTFFNHLLFQPKFRQCSDRSRWWVHMILFSGFALMFVVKLFFLRWFQTDELLPLYHPQRWLGYLAFGAIVYGSLDILVGRITRKRQMHRFSDAGDIMLPLMLLLVALSGMSVHIFRYLGMAMAAHYSFFAHVVLASTTLLVEVPFGKLSHLVYRPLAVYLDAVRKRAGELAGQELAA